MTFNGVGRVVPNPTTTALPAPLRSPTSSSRRRWSSDPRILHVVVGNDKSATGIRICDTKFAFDDPLRLPPGHRESMTAMRRLGNRAAHLPGRRSQRGSFLLEALVGIAILSFGILGIVGLQAQSIRWVNDAQYRSEAIYLANAVISRMWADNPANLTADYAKANNGSGYKALNEAVKTLPQCRRSPTTRRDVTVVARPVEQQQRRHRHRPLAPARRDQGRLRRQGRQPVRDLRRHRQQLNTMTQHSTPLPRASAAPA